MAVATKLARTQVTAEFFLNIGQFIPDCGLEIEREGETEREIKKNLQLINYYQVKIYSLPTLGNATVLELQSIKRIHRNLTIW
jgi:hypothetical protein